MELARGAQRTGAEEDAKARVSLQGKMSSDTQVGKEQSNGKAPANIASTTPGSDGVKATMWKGPPSPPIAQPLLGGTSLLYCLIPDVKKPISSPN